MMRTRPFRLLLALVCSSASLANAATPEPRRIYLANDDHTDYMWATDAETYDATFVEFLDFHLKLTDETVNNPSPFRNRFNTDGSFWLWNYERKKTPAEFARLMERIKQGYISSPLNTLVSCYGGQPVEAVLRGMYYAGRLERRFDVRFRLATATENQTLPLGLASLFAGAGAHYSWRGVCACASKLSDESLGQRDREIYWYTGHDDQRLLMKWYSVAQGEVPVESGAGTPRPDGRKMVPRRDVGIYAEARGARTGIQYIENDPGFQKRYTDPVSGQTYQVYGLFGFGGDAIMRQTGVPGGVSEVPGAPGIPRIPYFPYADHFHVIAQEQTTPERQVIVSNEIDFFEEFEKRYGRTLESHRVTYGNEWDLYSASMSETSARAKRTVEKLRSAELMATLVSLELPTFMNSRIRARDEAFTALGLYWEHNWTADGQVSAAARAAWQEKMVEEVEHYVDSLHGDSLLRLRGMISRPEKSQRFFVLNPLAWLRTGAADYVYRGPSDIHVHDVTAKKDVPHQLFTRDGIPYLRIWADGVPSAGYKVYEIREGAGTADQTPAAVLAEEGERRVIENDAIRIVVAPDGAVESFVDKAPEGSELAATIDGLALNDFAAGSAEGERIRLENVGPVSLTVRAVSAAGTPHASSITVYRNSSRVDFHNEITANFADMRHWGFSFALPNPSVHTEEVGAINLNKRKSEGGHYADRLARYDYITLNHFADIVDGTGQRGMTLSNADLAFARLGRSTAQELDTTTPQISPLAGGQVDGPGLGVPAQNGETRFVQRFALRPHRAYDPVSAMRFALEHQNPLVTGELIGSEAGSYPADTYSLVQVGDPSVLVWAVKPADDGFEKGIVVRTWNVQNRPATAALSFARGIREAFRTTHIETDLGATPVSNERVTVTHAPQQLMTHRLIPAR